MKFSIAQKRFACVSNNSVNVSLVVHSKAGAEEIYFYYSILLANVNPSKSAAESFPEIRIRFAAIYAGMTFAEVAKQIGYDTL